MKRRSRKASPPQRSCRRWAWKPFEHEIALIVFFNVDDGIMFKVFAGGDEKRELKADQIVKFRSLGERLCGC